MVQEGADFFYNILKLLKKYLKKYSVPVRALVRTPGAGGMRRLVFSEGRLLDAFPGCRILTDGWRRVPLRALGKSFTGTLAFSQPTPGPDAICDTPE